jgi:hypothetical protein
MSTSEALHARALRFFDTLIKVLRFRNHEIQAGYRRTEVSMYGERIEIWLNEKNKRVNDPTSSYPRTDSVPTGILYFAARPNYNDKVWTDGQTRLEDQLSHIVAYLEVKAKVACEETKIRRIEEQKQEEKRRIQKELEQRQDLELKNFKLLLKKTERWQQLKLIRGYIDELEAKSMERNLVTQEIKEWVEWARGKADWYDPQVNAADELLNDVDKETLTFNRRSSNYW